MAVVQKIDCIHQQGETNIDDTPIPDCSKIDWHSSRSFSSKRSTRIQAFHDGFLPVGDN